MFQSEDSFPFILTHISHLILPNIVAVEKKKCFQGSILVKLYYRSEGTDFIYSVKESTTKSQINWLF